MKLSKSAVGHTANYLFIHTIIVCSVFILSMTLFGERALSVELESADSVVNVESAKLPLSPSPSPIQTSSDTCLSLLKSARNFADTSLSTDRNRRAAGKAAVIGLVFGVRFALGPKQTNKSTTNQNKAVRFDIWQPRDESGVYAMAIADYRRCKNEQALRALSDWRWAR